MTIHVYRRTSVLILALATALTAPALTPLTASAASLKPLVVQASEVSSAFGSGFKALSSRPMRAADLTGTSSVGMNTTTLMKGYVGGYFSSFYRSSIVRSGKSVAMKPGVSIVTSGVSLYRSAAYPAGALELAMKNKATILKSLRKQHVTDVHIDWFSGLGDKAIMMVYGVNVPAITPGSHASKSMAITFIFSRGKFAATLNVSGQGTISKDQALTVAKHVDNRLQHAG